MFSEMSYLFISSRSKKLPAGVVNPNDVTSEYILYNKENNMMDSIQNPSNDSNKKIISSGTLKNFIKNNVNKLNTTTTNPYISLVDNTNSTPQRLEDKDIIYLRDLGVYPINRLVILRRYSNDTLVHADLNDIKHSKTDPADEKKIIYKRSKPISTVVGWIKEDDDIMNFSFHEGWKSQQVWLHDLLREIIQNSFGIDIAGIFPIPGWGQGMLFDMLNRMGLTDYDKFHTPIGDPNLLREGVTRETDSQGILSNFKFELETCYEQRFISPNKVDDSFFEILTNLLKMGTSDMRFLGNSSKISAQLGQANQTGALTDWTKFLVTTLTSFITGMQAEMTKVKDALGKTITKGKKDLATEDAAAKSAANPVGTNGVLASTTTNSTQSTATTQSDFGTTFGQQTQTPTVTQSDDANSAGNTTEGRTSAIKKLNDFMTSAAENSGILTYLMAELQGIIEYTIGRYQWKIIGALNQLTGGPTTPWHLTIGNPNAPILSMNHIIVENVDVTLGKELMYNDLPKFINVKITIVQSRNLGKQEISKMFGVEYKRNYTNKKK